MAPAEAAGALLLVLAEVSLVAGQQRHMKRAQQATDNNDRVATDSQEAQNVQISMHEGLRRCDDAADNEEHV